MIDMCPQAGRILLAKHSGPAKHHVERNAPPREHGEAVAALRELADVRADLLAELRGGSATGRPGAHASALWRPAKEKVKHRTHLGIR
jgi:hypothetical protein